MNAPSEAGDENRHRGYISIQAGDPQTLDFLAYMGWHLKSSRERFDYRGDIVINDDFVVGKYSHGSGVVEYCAPEDLHKADRVMVHVCLSGAGILHTSTGSVALAPLDVVRVPTGELKGFESEDGATSMFVIYGSPDVSRQQETLVGQSNEIDLGILNAAATSLLCNVPEQPSPGFTQVQRALEELAKAVAVGVDLGSDSDVDALTKVYVRGMALIGSMATDEKTTVESVAHDLGVSRSYLLRAFKTHGSSPSIELRQARLANAERLLREGAADLTAVAAQSGFSTVRKLKRALTTDTTIL
ncbi:AraC family transcriptional regulator [Brevibacterium aurantiacum]|uniref:Helix-turn-helix transcriptional regulator n=1 Tax=Brevibacterium aurantiacum TaxID=273384 RepID=A0A556C9D4_BREAU|nr:AraC family transcriptional regulator [Brevibacterium aurantiacum]TSI14072.1 helix-turn-helix transcriptional regulator [Brevibacterium aurantiacum]